MKGFVHLFKLLTLDESKSKVVLLEKEYSEALTIVSSSHKYQRIVYKTRIIVFVMSRLTDVN